MSMPAGPNITTTGTCLHNSAPSSHRLAYCFSMLPCAAEQIIESLVRDSAAIELKSVHDLYNQAAQNEALGPFSKEAKLTVPFFAEDVTLPDMRFASMVPEIGRAHV